MVYGQLPQELQQDTVIPVELDETVIEAFRKNNFKCFCKYYLPHLFPLPFCRPVHDVFAKDIEDARHFSVNSGYLAPREVAKTTVVCIAGPLYWVAHNRQEKIFITQKTGNVSQVIQAIMYELSENSKLIADFGEFRPSNRNLKWSYSEGGVVEGAVDKKNPTIAGAGVCGGSIGYRLTKALIDDIWDPTNVCTEAQRVKVKTWIRVSVIAAVVSDGSTFMTNSTYHEDDYLNEMDRKKIQAISYTDRRGVQRTLEFKVRRWDSIVDEKNHVTIWPEKNSWERLMYVKAQVGPVIFDQQYRNITMSEATAPFKMATLEDMKNVNISYVDHIDNIEPYTAVVQMWDLANCDNAQQAEENDTDYYTCLTVGITEDRHRRILHLEQFRGLEAPQVLDQIDMQYRTYRPDMVIVESNAFQRWMADYMLRFKNMPVHKSVTITTDRQALKLKSSVLHVAIYNKLWEFPYRNETDEAVTEKIWHQLFYFGKEKHDDIVMTMYFLEKTLGDVQQIIMEQLQEQGTTETIDDDVNDSVVLQN